MKVWYLVSDKWQGGEAERRMVHDEAVDAGFSDWRRSQNVELSRSTRRLMALLGITDFVERKGNYGIRILVWATV